ncbi:MAG: hypothetical protein AAGA58_01130 [Verrucomicrobiota bacterium]
MTKLSADDFLLLLLRLGAFLCFAGWTWTHLYWEGPYGILLWQDGTYALAERFGISWDEFVGTGTSDGVVQKWIGRIGWLYLGCAILCLTVRQKSRFQLGALAASSGLLAVLFYAKYVGAQRQLAMFVEHGGQLLVPVILVMALALGVRHRVAVVTAIVAFIMTFTGHGAYALGYPWPTPSNFHAMTTGILGLNYEAATIFLRAAGVLDLVVCVGIFFPRVRQWCALYAAAWGFVTALARPVAGMSLSLNYWGADLFLHEFVLRAPHYLIPLYLFFLWREPTAAKESTEQTEFEESKSKPADLAAA